jgi:hypothetical protein
MPRSTPQRVSCRGRPFATAFRSPTTAPDSLRLHSRVKVPGLLLHDSCPELLRPVRLSAPLPHAGCARHRQLHCVRPVAVSTPDPARCLPGFHSPSGPLRPSGSKRSAGWLLANPPSDSARSPFAPRCRHLLLEHSAADHRSRSSDLRLSPCFPVLY